MKIDEILFKAKQRDIPQGFCYHCRKPIDNYNKSKKYHAGCLYDSKKYDIKARFKNHKYMYIYLGTGYSRGQGSRCGSMVKGSMSVAEDMWSQPVPVTIENVKMSLYSHKNAINLCNGTWLSADEGLLLAKYLENENI